MTALHLAVAAGHRNSTRSLIAASKHVNDTDRSGNTPLHLAARRGDSILVEALLEAGADPNVRNVAGTTPLIIAVAMRNRSVLPDRTRVPGFR